MGAARLRIHKPSFDHEKIPPQGSFFRIQKNYGAGHCTTFLRVCPQKAAVKVKNYFFFFFNISPFILSYLGGFVHKNFRLIKKYLSDIRGRVSWPALPTRVEYALKKAAAKVKKLL